MVGKAGLLSFIALIALSGCATPKSDFAEAQYNLQAVPKSQASSSAAAIAATAIQWRFTWTATNLLERVVDADPTIKNRFNLATGYENTGRYQDALNIYSALLKDGEYTWLYNIP